MNEKIVRFAKASVKPFQLGRRAGGSTSAPPPDDSARLTPDQVALAARFKSAFGHEGIEWFLAGESYSECQTRFTNRLKEENDRLSRQVEQHERRQSQHR